MNEIRLQTMAYDKVIGRWSGVGEWQRSKKATERAVIQGKQDEDCPPWACFLSGCYKATSVSE
eukprot:CAMPEP_0174331142 /NCGR_PEP_ID=MMETSP0810-20121108/17252_1 /TAXON_ID=73025 ORGANISM="Eutreptiella gymnastica-like, Strain CCMP1594" /NCGR_SAMPLE_ID=MMETSP0810 /ASSEMBLY_ACC=CAM_ASM_000659 /LENGTH=62 /DNA_ID=CAMNT_0015446755 /DNA_START=726 /DNA_END=914 /DNA_ORIENTATION=+